MSQLRTYLEDYIKTLQTLQAQYSDNQALLDAAEDKWGAEDYRFMVLQESPKGVRWPNKSGEPSPEEQKPENEPNELIDWLPSYVRDCQKVSRAGDDEAVLKEAAKTWKLDSYGNLVVQGVSETKDY